MVHFPYTTEPDDGSYSTLDDMVIDNDTIVNACRTTQHRYMDPSIPPCTYRGGREGEKTVCVLCPYT